MVRSLPRQTSQTSTSTPKRPVDGVEGANVPVYDDSSFQTESKKPLGECCIAAPRIDFEDVKKAPNQELCRLRRHCYKDKEHLFDFYRLIQML